MGKLIYERTCDVFEADKITLEFDDVDIYEFKVLCKRLASAIGYHYDSIQEAFGSESTDPQEMVAQAKMNEALNIDTIEKFFDTEEH